MQAHGPLLAHHEEVLVIGRPAYVEHGERLLQLGQRLGPAVDHQQAQRPVGAGVHQQRVGGRSEPGAVLDHQVELGPGLGVAAQQHQALGALVAGLQQPGAVGQVGQVAPGHHLVQLAQGPVQVAGARERGAQHQPAGQQVLVVAAPDGTAGHHRRGGAGGVLVPTVGGQRRGQAVLRRQAQAIVVGGARRDDRPGAARRRRGDARHAHLLEHGGCGGGVGAIAAQQRPAEPHLAVEHGGVVGRQPAGLLVEQGHQRGCGAGVAGLQPARGLDGSRRPQLQRRRGARAPERGRGLVQEPGGGVVARPQAPVALEAGGQSQLGPGQGPAARHGLAQHVHGPAQQRQLHAAGHHAGPVVRGVQLHEPLHHGCGQPRGRLGSQRAGQTVELADGQERPGGGDAQASESLASSCRGALQGRQRRHQVLAGCVGIGAGHRGGEHHAALRLVPVGRRHVVHRGWPRVGGGGPGGCGLAPRGHGGAPHRVVGQRADALGGARRLARSGEQHRVRPTGVGRGCLGVGQRAHRHEPADGIVGVDPTQCVAAERGGGGHHLGHHLRGLADRAAVAGGVAERVDAGGQRPQPPAGGQFLLQRGGLVTDAQGAGGDGDVVIRHHPVRPQRGERGGQVAGVARRQAERLHGRAGDAAQRAVQRGGVGGVGRGLARQHHQHRRVAQQQGLHERDRERAGALGLVERQHHGRAAGQPLDPAGGHHAPRPRVGAVQVERAAVGEQRHAAHHGAERAHGGGQVGRRSREPVEEAERLGLAVGGGRQHRPQQRGTERRPRGFVDPRVEVGEAAQLVELLAQLGGLDGRFAARAQPEPQHTRRDAREGRRR